MFTKNLIQLTGNIASDPETRTVNGTTVARARLIHNDEFRRDDGSTIERIAAIDLEIWGKRGDAFAEHITSKVPVFIEGKLELSQWEHEGQKRSRLFVRVTDWQFLMAKSEAGGETEPEAPKADAPKDGAKGQAPKGAGKPDSKATPEKKAA